MQLLSLLQPVVGGRISMTGEGRRGVPTPDSSRSLGHELRSCNLSDKGAGDVYSVWSWDSGPFVCCEGGGDGRRSLDTDAPVTIQRGFGQSGPQGWGRHTCSRFRSLPHMLDCCTDSTGGGGMGWIRAHAKGASSRVRHGSYTWVGCTGVSRGLFVVRGVAMEDSLRGPGPAVGPTGAYGSYTYCSRGPGHCRSVREPGATAETT